VTWSPEGPLGPVSPRPGSDAWADAVRDRLFEQRTIMLRGELTDAAASQAAAELMTLDALGDSRITVHIDLTGGTLDSAFAVMDVIDLVGVPVHVRCVGRAEGPAVGVLAVAARRAMSPHARARLADPTMSASGRASELSAWAEHQLSQLRRFHQRLADAVHRPIDVVADDCGRGRYLTADDALRYGLIDEIATPRGVVQSLRPRSIGFPDVT
jgi:ATP-dependent Clp protease protease subunit